MTRAVKQTMTVPVEILLVEDSLADIRLLREALKGGRLLHNLNVVRDGKSAVDYLRRRGPYAGAARPDFVILDLNLPRMNGQEVLAKIKSDPDLKRIPMAVLTTSHSERDIRESYSRHANCYIVKPPDFHAFTGIVRTIEDFWFRTATLPPD